MLKRGRPPQYDEKSYKNFGQIFQTDNKRNIQNNLHKAQAMKVLSDYVVAGNEIPHFDYILDVESLRSNTKYSFTYKQTVFTELGRLYNYIESMEDDEAALNFLVKYTGSLCELAFEYNLSVREMEQEVRNKRKEVKDLYQKK